MANTNTATLETLFLRAKYRWATLLVSFGLFHWILDERRLEDLPMLFRIGESRGVRFIQTHKDDLDRKSRDCVSGLAGSTRRIAPSDFFLFVHRYHIDLYQSHDG